MFGSIICQGKGLLPSRDLTHGSLASLGVKKYYQLSGQAVQYLAACFKVAFPEYYKKYEVAFAVGQWSKSDPGPWIGQVIVWKLQVHAHEDGLDDGPTCAFPLGSFTGGRLYLPDLDLRFRYMEDFYFLFVFSHKNQLQAWGLCNLPVRRSLSCCQQVGAKRNSGSRWTYSWAYWTCIVFYPSVI